MHVFLVEIKTLKYGVRPPSSYCINNTRRVVYIDGVDEYIDL